MMRDPALRAAQGRQDSNLQPPVLETGALPVELRPYVNDSTGVRRRPLGALFLMLAALFAGIGFVAAVEGGRAWVVAIAAAALAVWMAEMALRALR